jgi:hypothetical protein
MGAGSVVARSADGPFSAVVENTHNTEGDRSVAHIAAAYASLGDAGFEFSTASVSRPSAARDIEDPQRVGRRLFCVLSGTATSKRRVRPWQQLRITAAAAARRAHTKKNELVQMNFE